MLEVMLAVAVLMVCACGVLIWKITISSETRRPNLPIAHGLGARWPIAFGRNRVPMVILTTESKGGQDARTVDRVDGSVDTDPDTDADSGSVM